MVHPVFLLTFGYFLFGGAAVLVINRRPARRAEGRALWTKFGVYFVIVHVVILMILAGSWRFAALAALLVAGGTYELIRTAARGGGRLLLVGTALLLYAAISLGFIQFALRLPARDSLFVYVVVLTFDGFSQITGQALGRHKLAPRISPGKTVEGLAGGLVMAAITALPLASWSGIARSRALELALLVCAAALAGDLAASWFKRLNGVKDYGSLLPGHGGILDRFDSFLAAGSVFWYAVGR